MADGPNIFRAGFSPFHRFDVTFRRSTYNNNNKTLHTLIRYSKSIPCNSQRTKNKQILHPFPFLNMYHLNRRVLINNNMIRIFYFDVTLLLCHFYVLNYDKSWQSSSYKILINFVLQWWLSWHAPNKGAKPITILL